MKTNHLMVFVITILMMVMGVPCAWAISGSGTSSDPYLIANDNDVLTYFEYVNNSTDTIYGKLTADVNTEVTLDVNAGCKANIHLNGHSISNIKENNSTIWNLGSLTIIDEIGTGGVYNNVPFSYPGTRDCIRSSTGSELYINGGTYQTCQPYDDPCLYLWECRVTISNAKLINSYSGFVIEMSQVNMNLTNVTIEGGVGRPSILVQNYSSLIMNNCDMTQPNYPGLSDAAIWCGTSNLIINGGK